jgi:hypothetical protein
MQANILSKKSSDKFEEALCPDCREKVNSFCERITVLQESEKFLDRLSAKKEMLMFPMLWKRLCPKCIKKFKKIITKS